MMADAAKWEFIYYGQMSPNKPARLLGFHNQDNKQGNPKS